MPAEIWTALVAVLILITVDSALGVVLAIARASFNIRQLPRFLQTAILSYVGGLVILAVAGIYDAQIRVLFYGAVAATSAKFIAELKDKVASLFGPRSDENGQGNANTPGTG